jgi:hypothetical protein
VHAVGVLGGDRGDDQFVGAGRPGQRRELVDDGGG